MSVISLHFNCIWAFVCFFFQTLNRVTFMYLSFSTGWQFYAGGCKLCFNELLSLLFSPCSSFHMTDGSNWQVACMNTTSEYVMSLWNPPPIPVVSIPPYITKKRMSSCPNVSSVNVGTVCLGKVSTWFMHKSAARWSQVVPWCTASGDLATRAVPLRWRVEPVTAKQIWNHATLCHKFLHSTEVTWTQGNLFSPICELKP